MGLKVKEEGIGEKEFWWLYNHIHSSPVTELSGQENSISKVRWIDLWKVSPAEADLGHRVGEKNATQ